MNHEDEDSVKHEEFNSKKYIEYLDSDMYPLETNMVPNINTINKEKQEELLRKLCNPRNRKSYEELDPISEEKLIEFQLRQLNRDLNDESKLSYRSLQSISEKGSTHIDEIQQNNSHDLRSIIINRNRKNILKCSSEKIIKYTGSK